MAFELDQRFLLDLAHAFAREAHLSRQLFQRGRFDVVEAEAVYRADLGFDATLSRAAQHPENVWSLHGLHECLEKLGKTTEALLIKPRLDLANARSDAPIKASCACRLLHMNG